MKETLQFVPDATLISQGARSEAPPAAASSRRNTVLPRLEWNGERLDALPHARLCITCKEKEEDGKRR